MYTYVLVCFKVSLMGLSVLPGDKRHMILLLWFDVFSIDGGDEPELEVSDNQHFFSPADFSHLLIPVLDHFAMADPKNL